MEAAFEQRVRDETVVGTSPEPTSAAVCAELFRMTGEDGGPSMSRFVAKSATDGQLREFLVHKSVNQLREADPHTWAIPRLSGRSKAAMVEIQADEYGNGLPARMHSALYARTMRELGMDDTYGGYVDAVPAITLAVNNLMSLFGLHRRLRGAIVGHLAAYEMTSSQPNRLYSRDFKRRGYGPAVTEYFDEHVEADAVHEQIAGSDMAGGLVESDPHLLGDVLFGAAAGLAIDTLMTVHIMDAWESGRPSLRAVGGGGLMDADRVADAQDTEDTPTDHPLNSGTAAPVSVVACTDGPLLVRGDFTLLGADGEELPRTRRTVALCRCGASVLKPYCDGSHKLTGFRSEP